MSDDILNILNSYPSLKNDYSLLIIKLKRKQVSGIQDCLKVTSELIRSIIGKLNFESTQAMMNFVRNIGKELMLAAPSELCIGNLIRRILFLIREEHLLCVDLDTKKKQDVKKQEAPTRRARTMSASEDMLDEMVYHHEKYSETVYHLPTFGATKQANPKDNFNIMPQSLKYSVMNGLIELFNEFSDYSSILKTSNDYVHSDEVILTYGYNTLIEEFLLNAASKRKFQIFIAENAPSLDGHKLALNLANKNTNKNIKIVVIPDNNIYPIINRCHKIFLGPTSVMADGGIISPAGHYMIALAAKEFNIPVISFAMPFTLTPLFAHNQSLVLKQLLAPNNSSILHTVTTHTNSNATIRCHTDPSHDPTKLRLDQVEVTYPAHDLVPPELISLHITSDGPLLPSFIFRQLSEYYHPLDYEL